MRTKKVNKHFHSRVLFKYLLSLNNKQKKRYFVPFFFKQLLFICQNEKTKKLQQSLCFLTFFWKLALSKKLGLFLPFVCFLFFEFLWVNLSTQETKEGNFSFCLWEHLTSKNKKNKSLKKTEKHFFGHTSAFVLCFVWVI